MNLSYDANGRVFKTSSTSITSQSNAVYDAGGHRVATQVDGVWTFFVYDIGAKLVAEYGGIQSTDDGGVKYVLKDWQGSSRGIVSNTGFAQGRKDYTAFGEEINSGVGQRTSAQGFGTADGPTEKYALTEKDKATGLDHTWFRKNESQAGRWTSPDPYSGSMNIADPQSFNRYSYVQNQPTNFVDPSGLEGACSYSGNKDKNGELIYDGHLVGDRCVSNWGPAVTVYSSDPLFVGGNPDPYGIGGAGPLPSVSGGGGGGFVRELSDAIPSPSPCLALNLAGILRPFFRAGEQAIGQDILPDAVKAEGSFLGMSIGLTNSRDGALILSGGGSVETPKSLFVDIPSAVMKGKALTPSGSLTAQKILLRGNPLEVQRTGILEGLSASFGGGYKLYGAVDVSNPTSSTSRTFSLNAGVGVGVSLGGLSAGKAFPFKSCFSW